MIHIELLQFKLQDVQCILLFDTKLVGSDEIVSSKLKTLKALKTERTIYNFR